MINDLKKKWEVEIQDVQRASEEKYRGYRKKINAEIKNVKKVLDKMESNLGCLSCTKVFQESFMLTCGHSICTGVSL